MCLAAGSMAVAKVTMPPLFTDNMVLQQRSQAPIWGRADPGKSVTVATSWDKKSYTTKADASGRWRVTAQTPKAGGPYTISVSDGEPTLFENVMIGEVWICSGQSNMEMQVEGWGKIRNWEEEKRAADYPNIRLLTVKQNTSPEPIDDFSALGDGWQVCSPETVGPFSAAGYFFGRDLHESLDVPIGLICTAWGGTLAEAWTSADALGTMPYFAEEVEKVRRYPRTREGMDSLWQVQVERWEEEIDGIDPGMKGNWSAAGLDDKAWERAPIPGMIQDLPGLENFNGMVWFRTSVSIPDLWAGKPVRLHLGSIDDIDDTFFNGTKVGGMDNWMAPRSYAIPARLTRKGNNSIAVRVFDTGGSGGFSAKAENIYLEGPGGERITLAGEWRYKVAAHKRSIPDKPRRIYNEPNFPAFLFNAMLNPLVPYSMKGVIWYQGEGNTGRGFQYRDMLPLMIQDWRNRWKSDFPFYIVQLAAFTRQQTEPVESTWAELREAQLMTAQHMSNCGLAVAIDIGEAFDIHPKNKQDVGRRLALAARAQTYGQKIPYSGPLYDSYSIEGDRIRLRFKHTDGGLKRVGDGPLKGFAIAGVDHKFHWAEAVIEGDEVVVSSPEVAFPVAVRYAWADNPLFGLYNGAGLPASPFRTDHWRGITYAAE